MVVGIPNVGKSTFINSLAGKAAAKTGNKPGVTKGKQWIRLNKQVELLDTPGILWPKFEDQTVGLRLALIGSIKDEVLQTEELAAELIRFLTANYPGVLENKYTITAAPDPYVMLGRIAESRHCLVRGNELDTEKAAMLLMDDFREGKLGRLTLEYPQTEEAVKVNRNQKGELTFYVKKTKKERAGNYKRDIRVDFLYYSHSCLNICHHYLCGTKNKCQWVIHGDDSKRWRSASGGQAVLPVPRSETF